MDGGDFDRFTNNGIQATQRDDYRGFLGGPAGPQEGAPAFSHTQNVNNFDLSIQLMYVKCFLTQRG